MPVDENTYDLNDEFTVTYTVTGLEPATVVNMPTTPQPHQWGSDVPIAASLQTTATLNGVIVGTWTFSGWVTENELDIGNNTFMMPYEDVAFTGSWTFTAAGVPGVPGVPGAPPPPPAAPAAAAPAAPPADVELVEIPDTAPPLASEIPVTPEVEPDEEPEDEMIIVIEDPDIPLAQGLIQGSWAFLNLILSIAGAMLALMLGIRVLMRKRQEKEGIGHTDDYC